MGLLMRIVFFFLLRLVGRAVRSGGAVVGTVLVLYFALFAFEGDRGLSSLQSLERRVRDAEAQLDTVSAERQAVERKVVALRPGSLNADLLEEVARSELGYVKPGEVVILGR